MEIKKSPKADLQNKKGLFLEIGLAIALGFTIFVFSWSQGEKVVEKFDMGVVKVEEEMVEITRQDQKPPEAPQAKTISVTADVLRVVKNDAKISTDFNFTDFDADAAIEVPKAKVVEEKFVEEEIFLTAETMPSFQGGDLNAFRTWVQKQLKYPIVAQENGIQGRVALSFVVGKDGSLKDVKVLQSPDKTLGEEAVRVVSSSPKWSPAKQRGNPVQLRYTLPVDFKIQ